MPASRRNARASLSGYAPLMNDFRDAGVDDHLRADDAGLGRGIEDGAPRARAMEGRLEERVLLGVEAAAKLMALARRTFSFSRRQPVLSQCVILAGGAVIAGGEDPLIPDEDRPHPAPQARRAPRHSARYRGNIRPSWASS